MRLPARRKPRGKPFEPGNAHRFPSGQSGNPGGRPKLLSDAYRERLAEVNPDDRHGRTWAEIIAAGMSIEAAKGGAPAAREIRAATEGTRIEHTGAGGGPIETRDIGAVRAERWEQVKPALAAALAPTDDEAGNAT